MSDKQYSMKAVSKLTGLTPDTLRAWERRYEAVVPLRKGSNRRIYTDAHVERLQLLKRATDQGHAIRLLAPLSNEQLRDLIGSEEPGTDAAAVSKDLVKRLISAVNDFDMVAFEQTLGWAAAALPPREIIERILRPLLEEVGIRWHRGDLSIAQEHAVSASLRNFIGAMIRLYPRRRNGRPIIFATLSGERHEFGVLLLYWLAASEGVPCYYLGPDVPAEDVARMVERTNSSVVAVSAVNQNGRNGYDQQLQTLYNNLQEKAEIWLGGMGADQIAARQPSLPLHVIPDLDEFDRRLKALSVS